MSARTNVLTVLVAVAASSVVAYVVGRSAGRCVDRHEEPSALADLAREVARLADAWRRPATLAASSDSSRAPTPEVVPPGPRLGGDAPRTSPPPPDALLRVAGSTLPPADVSKATELETWDDQEEVRRRWMFLPESAVLATFGTPTEVVNTDGGSESWVYETHDLQVTLQMVRGRLVRAYVTRRTAAEGDDR